MHWQGSVEPKRKLRNQAMHFALYFLCPLFLFSFLSFSTQGLVNRALFLFSIFFDLFLFFIGRKRLNDVSASSNIDKEPFLYGIWLAVEKAQNFGHFYALCTFVYFYNILPFLPVSYVHFLPVVALPQRVKNEHMISPQFEPELMYPYS